MNNDLIAYLLMLISALSIVNGSPWSTYRHRRHSNDQMNDVEGSGNSDEDIEYEEDGNGFELEGLKGHGALFSGFVWTRSELAKISLWHASAQHFKAAELVEKKLAELNATQEFPRDQIRSFLEKFEAPQSERHFFNNQQVHRIRNLHRMHKVGEITTMLFDRLMQLDPMVRQELVQYFNLSRQC